MIGLSMLPQRCDIDRPVKAHDGAGGWAETWQRVASAQRCRVGAAGTYTGKAYADTSDPRPQRPVWLLPNVDVREGDRVAVAGVGVFDVVWADPQADGAYVKLFCDPHKGAA